MKTIHQSVNIDGVVGGDILTLHIVTELFEVVAGNKKNTQFSIDTMMLLWPLVPRALRAIR